MPVLDIYVARHCLGYKEAIKLAKELEEGLSNLHIKVTVLDEVTGDDSPDIPATPAYFLNGHLLFLGNPGPEEVVSKIASLSQGRGGDHG